MLWGAVARDRRREVEGDLIELWHRRRAAGRLDLRRAYLRDLAGLILAQHRTRRIGAPRRASRRAHPGFALWQDVGQAVRVMRSKPGSTLAAVATLAIGIGAALAIFTAVDRLLLRPLPFPDPDSLVHVQYGPVRLSAAGSGVSKSFTDLPVIAAAGIWAAGGLNLDGGGDAVRIVAASVDDGFFATMSVAPFIGQPLPKPDGVSRHAVLSYDLWRGRFNADRAMLGQTVSLNGNAYTVTGVMPPGFSFPGRTEVWIPQLIDRQITGAAFAPNVVARLAPDVSLEQARQVAAAYERSRRPSGVSPGREIALRPLAGELTSGVRPTLLLLAAGAAMLLLVVCASVANLLLARVAMRSRELTVRRALGASRWRLARQLLVESLMLSCAGALAGGVLAASALQILGVLAPAELDAVSVAAIDARFALMALGGALITAVMFGVSPGLAAASRQAGDVVRAGRHDTQRPFWRRFRSVLIAGQMAAALVLLTASSAAVASLLEVWRIDPGFGSAPSVSMTLTLPAARFDTPAKVASFFERARTRVAAVPGVRAVGGTSMLPGSPGIGSGVEVRRDGHARREGERPLFAQRLRASPDYFRVMGIRLVAGRAFSDADRIDAPPVVVLSEGVARGLFNDPRAAIGQRLRISRASSAPSHEVVGVVADVHFGGLEPGERLWLQLYQPLLQAPPSGALSVVAEAEGEPTSIVAALRSAMREVDPTIPPYRIELIRATIDRYLASRRLAGTLISGFAVSTLLVAAIGLYGLIAQLVTERAREIGIRVALGAAPHSVRRRIVRDGMAHAAGGAALGALGATGTLQWFGAVMPGLESPGPWVFVFNATVLLAAALAATWIPASRVIRIDPAAALRQ